MKHTKKLGATSLLPSDAEQHLPLSGWVFVLAALATLLHFLFNRGYGYFRDELYYAVCGQHLAWGYVDHASAGSSGCAPSTRATFWAISLAALRFVPALSGAAKVVAAGWMARGKWGEVALLQFFAALTTLIAPIYLTFDNFLSMNAFEPVFLDTVRGCRSAHPEMAGTVVCGSFFGLAWLG